jgi:Flp pilus assembly pilin Flp
VERLKRWLIKIATGQRGQDMVEYAMIVLLISVPIVLVGFALLPAFEAWANQVVAALANTGG